MEARSLAASISLNSAALARAGLEMAEAVPMMMMGSSAGKAVELFDIASFFASSLARLAQSAERKALNGCGFEPHGGCFLPRAHVFVWEFAAMG